MWYPVSDTVVSEPIGLAEARIQTQIDEADFDGNLSMLVASARAHVERYCGRSFASHQMTWSCDAFADLDRLPAAPLTEVDRIEYTDAEGVTLTLDPATYVPRPDGLSPAVVLAPGQSWPQTQPGSRIALTAKFGGDVPPDVLHAMLILVSEGFTSRENVARPVWTAVDALLCNHRRGIW